MKILAIDPGTEQSGYVIWDTDKREIVHKGIENNRELCTNYIHLSFDVLVIEMVACFGMPIGKSTLETVLWIGRFFERSREVGATLSVYKAYRKDIKLFLCQTMRAKDANVRQALIDRLGEPGTKKNPGKTYGVIAHLWSALAIAIYAEHNLDELEEVV